MRSITWSRFVALSVIFTSFSACSAAEELKAPEPGRCYSNDDCSEGETCRATFCEDIYYPEKNIKIN